METDVNGSEYYFIVPSCSQWHQSYTLQAMAISLYWKCWWHTVQMCSTRHKWVTLGSGTHNLIQHSTHDTNHVHRVQSLPFTLLPMVDPLSVSSTCCPSLETGSLRWMRMVGHAFTMQFGVVASQWWGTSWTSVDFTSAWEMRWVVEWYMTLCLHTIHATWNWWAILQLLLCVSTNAWLFCETYVYIRYDSLHVHSCTYIHTCMEGQHHQCGSRNLSWQHQMWQCSVWDNVPLHGCTVPQSHSEIVILLVVAHTCWVPRTHPVPLMGALVHFVRSYVCCACFLCFTLAQRHYPLSSHVDYIRFVFCKGDPVFSSYSSALPCLHMWLHMVYA